MLLFQTFYTVPFMNLRNRKGGALSLLKSKKLQTRYPDFLSSGHPSPPHYLGIHTRCLCLHERLCPSYFGKTESVLQVNRFRGEKRNRSLFQFVTPV